MKLDSLINLTFFFLLITLGLLNKSCKEDKNLDKSEEDIFLDDHYSPNKKWGYVNSAGKLAISDKFDDCRDFSENKAAINYKGKWGFIDTYGGFVIEPIYREAYGYRNGYGIVRSFDDTWRLIDQKGNTKLRLNADRVFLPEDKIVRYQKQGVYRYLSIDGDTISNLKFLRATDFNNSIAIVKQTDQYQLMDMNGKLFSEKYDRIFPQSEEFFRVKQNGEYFFINSDGNKIHSKKYIQAFDYKDGEALVKVKDKFQVIDTNGKILTILNYSLAEPAGQHLYRVFKDNKWGLANHKGTLLVDTQYDMFYNCSESRIAFSKNGLWGYMDLEGHIIRSAKHPLVWDFREGLARVIEAKRGIGFIDMGGDMVIPPYFVDVRDFYENLARVQVY